MIFGIVALLLKDVMDEFFSVQMKRLEDITILRWGAYVFILSSILLTGVFGADQFIYANF